MVPNRCSGYQIETSQPVICSRPGLGAGDVMVFSGQNNDDCTMVIPLCNTVVTLKLQRLIKRKPFGIKPSTLDGTAGDLIYVSLWLMFSKG